jgi:hypothetical protein
MRTVALLLFSLSCASFSAALEHQPDDLARYGSLLGLSPKEVSQFLPERAPECLTTELFALRRYAEKASQNRTHVSSGPRHGKPAPLASCRLETACDSAQERNKADPTRVKTVRIAFHTFVKAAGQYVDGLSPAVYEAAAKQLMEFFGSYGIAVDVASIQFHVTPQFCLPAYSTSNFDWYYALQDMKKNFAVSPQTTLNVFASCQTQGTVGTLLGIATFPWDRDALTSVGGLWVNTQVCAPFVWFFFPLRFIFLTLSFTSLSQRPSIRRRRTLALRRWPTSLGTTSVCGIRSTV